MKITFFIKTFSKGSQFLLYLLKSFHCFRRTICFVSSFGDFDKPLKKVASTCSIYSSRFQFVSGPLSDTDLKLSVFFSSSMGVFVLLMKVLLSFSSFLSTFIVLPLQFYLFVHLCSTHSNPWRCYSRWFHKDKGPFVTQLTRLDGDKPMRVTQKII